jgi:hypothetical protein
MIDPLKEELRTLARELQGRGIPLIIGGGYGLVLRTKMIAESGSRTLIPDFPSARSTEDLDIFLKAEVISDPEKTAAIREVLDRCGYGPVVPNFQFQREVDYRDRSRSVKVDLLAAPVPAELSTSVKVDSVRIRPRGGQGLHAHVTPEALTVEESMILIDIGEGEESLPVYLPHPFSYLLLKLYALRDRLHDRDVDNGRHHAFDLYTTIATMTEQEWGESMHIKDTYKGTPQVIEARNIANDLFADETAPGALRLREHARGTGYALSREQLDFFLDNMRQLMA